MTQEALRMAHKALIGLSIKHGEMTDEGMDAITAIEKALAQEKALQALHNENERLGLYKDAYAQPEQEPVAYLCENAVGHKYFRWKKPSSTYKPIALYTTPPQRKPMTEWQPIETAPKDGTYILLGSTDGAWVASYKPVYQSGYRPEDPWHSMMLNHEHMGRYPKAKPTHWQPLPLPPAAPSSAQPEQEPVAWTLLLTGEHNGLIGKAGEKFIGAPDYYQRVNVYTALPQRTWVGLTDEEIDGCDWGQSERDYARTIEAKLKQKNGYTEEKNT
jgi:hypothetical protein